MNRTRPIIFSFILVPWLISCAKYDQSLTVSDVQTPQVIVLRKVDGQGTIYGMSLQATGRLDGKATFILILNDKPYKIAHASDGVSFKWGGDWYVDTAAIHYEPTNVKVGSIVFHYSFHDIK